MSAYEFQANGFNANIRAREARQSKALFAATFPLFLAAALVKRAVNIGRDSGSRKPLIAEARAAANTCIPFVFMR